MARHLDFVLCFIIILIMPMCDDCKKATGSGGNQLSAKNKAKLENKVQQLLKLSDQNNAMAFNSDKYRQFVTSHPRNYSMFIMFTALSPQRRCRPCREAAAGFDNVWYSWRSSLQYPTNQNLFFMASVDFDDGQDIFRMYGFNSAPIFMHFSADGHKSRQDTFDGQVKGFSADSLARWISERTSIQKFKISTPPDYQFIFTSIAVAAVVCIIVVTQFERIQSILGRTQWACIILLIVLFFMSGEMWNRIRHPPFYGRDRDGRTLYMAPGNGSQYGAETFVMMALYGACTLGLVLLNDGAKYFHKRRIKQGVALAGLAVYFLFINVIVGIFSSKYQGYPYNFLFKW